jgi:hypothetical protein
MSSNYKYAILITGESEDLVVRLWKELEPTKEDWFGTKHGHYPGCPPHFASPEWKEYTTACSKWRQSYEEYPVAKDCIQRFEHLAQINLLGSLKEGIKIPVERIKLTEANFADGTKLRAYLLKDLPYVDENNENELHYEAYWSSGSGRSLLRSGLPVDHPEHLYKYLSKHGIDWKQFFDEPGQSVPMDKLFGKIPNTREQYTEADMEAAFNGGAANAAKERIWKKDGLIPPILDFKQWIDKHNDKA